MITPASALGFAPRLALGVAALAPVAIGSAVVQTPAAPSLSELLKPRYKVTRTGVTAAGVTITDPGSVLVIRKGGLLSAPSTNVAICAAQFKDGAIKSPNSFCTGMMGPTAHFLSVGTKVYVTKMEVNEKKNTIQFQLIECDSCNGLPAPTFKTAVSFQFEPNFLATAEPGQITDILDQVIAPDGPGEAETGGSNPAPTPAPDTAKAPAPPAQIQIGDSPAQVEAILGAPDTKIPLGAKLIYVYRNLKVTFLNQKVSDVQ
jgi:hypothetical protein